MSGETRIGTSRRTTNWIILNAAVALVVGSSCGGGCGGCGMEPIPGGFPSAERQANAVQVRVSNSGLTQITNNPAAILSGIGSGPAPGVVEFGGIQIDLNKATNDAPRLVITPQGGASLLDVTMRARLKTPTPMPVDIPLVGTCDLTIDTTGALTPDTDDDCGPVPNPPNPGDGNHCDVKIDVPISFVQEASPILTTRVTIGTVEIEQLTPDDIELGGNIGCQIANGAVNSLNFVFDLLLDQMTGTIQQQIEGQVCKKCPSGTVDECGPFASACTDNVCEKSNGDCLQELGLAGRMRAGAVLGSISPGTTGAIDLYEVAGGYATTNNGGIALGMLGGMVPGGVARDRCGPPATAPANATIGQSQFFQNNTRPDNGDPFDVAFGVHKSQLADFAYAGYDGGFLCLTMTSASVSQISTDTISLLARSLSRLVEGNSPMAVGLRPQSPPTIVLGKNTFTDDGNGNVTLNEPLLDITFTGMEIDFFAAVDDQYVRVMTVVTDVHFPIGLQVTAMGELSPVIGDVEDAFTNLSVKNSEALTESPDEIAELFPSILNLVLPQLSSGLGAIALPELGGLKLDVTAVTAVPTTPGGTESDFLAIFANLAVGTFQKPVTTTATVGDIYHPPAEQARHPSTWRKASRQPSVQLHLGADGQQSIDLEYSWQIDHGTWSAWSKNPNPVITSRVFWLPGTHQIEVRARHRGQPETVDLTPVGLTVQTGANSGVVRFHGTSSGGGCDCDASNNPTGALPFALIVLGLLLPLRRVRRSVEKLQKLGGTIRSNLVRAPVVVLVAAIACLPACSCGSDYCGDADCLDGDLAHGGLGRWTSIAGDEGRVMAATHDQGLGDLVVADVTNPDAIALVAVDGIPTDVTPTYAEDSYRRGIEGEGPNVGAWTSIAMSGGLARVAYQDRDTGSLKFALEPKAGTLTWNTMVVDQGSEGQETGRYASLAFDANGNPVIAYIALGLDDGAGHRNTELRLARSGTATPAAANDWTVTTIATGVGSCAGLCGAGEACVVGEDGQTCTAISSDCSAECAEDTEACVAGSCVEAFPEPEVADIATGTGLFVDLVLLADGKLAAVYYDRNARELRIAVENAPGQGVFTEATLDGGGTADRGMWASAVSDGSTIHIAYQDALGDQLFYTTFNGSPGTPELVDDGTRDGDRTHNVGAAAAIFLVSGAPQIAYQDGLTADVYLASRGGGTWATQGISISPLLDGFSIGATTGHGQPYLAWDRLDPAQEVPNGLFVQAR